MFTLRLLRDRNFILLLAIGLGLLLGDVARHTEPLILPALALVMTFSAGQVSSREFLSWRVLLRSTVVAVLLNYLVLGGALLALAWLLVPDPDLRAGLVLVAVVPPGVAIVPFTYVLGGNPALSLIGTVGAYLAALIITPSLALLLVGQGLIQPAKLVTVLVQIVVIPLALSRLLLLPRLVHHAAKWRGAVVNWGFFVVVFTSVGLNREVFLGQPAVLGVCSAIALVTTIGLGQAIEAASGWLGADRRTSVSLQLLGTIKNSGLAAATALALLSERAAVPGAVISAVYALYFIWLGLRHRRAQARALAAQRPGGRGPQFAGER